MIQFFPVAPTSTYRFITVNIVLRGIVYDFFLLTIRAFGCGV